MNKPLIAVVDYEMGNLHSVSKALEIVGGRVKVTSSPALIRQASAVVLPGVGAFGEAVKRLTRLRLMGALGHALERRKPFLGICLGLQLLFESSEESPREKGLGFLKGRVLRFPCSMNAYLKVPHMGWNQIEKSQTVHTPLLRRLRTGTYFYFVHSFFPQPDKPGVVATATRYGRSFCSSVALERLFACQFHPEKSGQQGLLLLKNFVQEVARCL